MPHAGIPNGTGAPGLQASWHLASRLQHSEQMEPVERGQSAMSGRSKSSSQTMQVSGRSRRRRSATFGPSRFGPGDVVPALGGPRRSAGDSTIAMASAMNGENALAYVAERAVEGDDGHRRRDHIDAEADRVERVAGGPA